MRNFTTKQKLIFILLMIVFSPIALIVGIINAIRSIILYIAFRFGYKKSFLYKKIMINKAKKESNAKKENRHVVRSKTGYTVLSNADLILSPYGSVFTIKA